MEEKATFSIRRLAKAGFMAALMATIFHAPVHAQISFNDESGRKADSRKIRREAARYKADNVKESHLDMDMYSYKRGAFGNRQVNEELASDEIYYGPNPVKKERKFFKKKR
jgi:hypothetical protein